MKKIILILIGIILGITGLNCNADLGGYTIESYKTEFILNEKGNLSVLETIDVNFNESRHGIYRKIPYKYSNNYTTPIKNINVYGEKYKTYNEGKNKIIKIGDLNETIIGAHTYNIGYEIKSTIRSFSGYQELYWNLLGDEWNTKINNFSFKITIPENIELNDNDYEIYYGPKGSTNKLSSILLDNTIENKYPIDLNENESITIVIRFKENTFNKSFHDKINDFRSTKFGNKLIGMKGLFDLILKLIGFTILFFSIIIGNCIKITLPPKHIKMKWNKIRDVIHYDHPKGFSPSEVLLLYKWQPDIGGIIMPTIYKWVSEGYLRPRIKRNIIGKKKVFFEIIGEKKEFGKEYRSCYRSDLEEELRINLIKKNKKLIEYKDIKNEYDIINDVSYKMFKSLKKELLKNGYNGYANTEYSKVSLLFIAIGGMVAGIYYFQTFNILNSIIIYFCFITIWITFLAVIRYKVAKTKRKNNYDEEHLTEEGKNIIEQILGYRKYLLGVENERLNKLVKEDPKYCEKVLPYAIALGIGNKWIKKCNLSGNKLEISDIGNNINFDSRGNSLNGMEYEIDPSGLGGSGGSDRGGDSGSSGGSSGGGGGGGGGGSR